LLEEAIMSDKKTLCEIFKKDMDKDDLRKYASLLSSPKYICKKCGRAANEKERVCKVVKI
jgi:hypothetical protein